MMLASTLFLFGINLPDIISRSRFGWFSETNRDLRLLRPLSDIQALTLAYGRDKVSYYKIILSEDYVESNVKKHLILVEQVQKYDNCHSCGAYIGGAVFSVRDSTWKVEIAQEHIFTIGTYGEAPPRKLVKIGPDRYGVLFTHSFSWALGYTTGGVILIEEIADKFETILDISTHAGNLAPCKWGREKCWSYNSSIEFIEEDGSPYYDIKISTFGTKKDGVDIVPVDKIIIYTFTDRKYEPSL